MLEELVPGVVHWTAFHEGIGATVHSAFVAGSGTLIDPMTPEGGLVAFERLRRPERVVLTNRHHFRHSARFVERFGCEVLVQDAGLSHFDGRDGVRGFRFDELLADDVAALGLGSICAEETTVHIDTGAGVLAFGDGLTRDGEELAFMPDHLLGDDPEHVRAGLTRALRTMLHEDFDTLLFAHADPLRSGGHDALEAFLARDASHV